jgi:hypothetical protein
MKEVDAELNEEMLYDFSGSVRGRSAGPAGEGKRIAV